MAIRFACTAVLAALLAVQPALAAPQPKPARFALQEPAPANTYTVEHGVRIPMRDGVRLSADVYTPKGVAGPFPTVLVRTPYSKDERFSKWVADMLSAHGYVVIAQDKRGRFESEGEYIFGDHEIADSYDTIDWIAKQPWSNQKVGAYGCSDRGDAAIYAAATRHPALKAVIAEAAAGAAGQAGGGYGYFSAINGGALEHLMGLEWMATHGTKAFLSPPKNISWEEYQRRRALGGYKINLTPPAIDWDKLVWHLPTIDTLNSVGLTGTDYQNYAGRPLDDPWWDERDFLKGDEPISTPALHVNSWFDFGAGVTLFQRELFEKNADNATARANQFAVISPTLHCRSSFATADFKIGDLPLGDARFGHPDLFRSWFDHWLKGADNQIAAMPKVQYYLMGKNEWRAAHDWPVPGSRKVSLYFDGEKAANGPEASGLLSLKRPRGGLKQDRFVYDPANPVKSLGGSLCCISNAKLEGSFDQREIEQRADVLTYSTPPLKQGLSVVGPIEVVLYVSSSALDTDFTAKLVDVFPDGTAYNLEEGILRARYREGFDKPKLMKPGEVYELRIRLQDIANYFAPGHQLRLEVSSSNFPRFDRNLNTGGDNARETKWVVATNTVHRDAKRPSRIELRVLDEK